MPPSRPLQACKQIINHPSCGATSNTANANANNQFYPAYATFKNHHTASVLHFWQSQSGAKLKALSNSNNACFRLSQHQRPDQLQLMRKCFHGLTQAQAQANANAAQVPAHRDRGHAPQYDIGDDSSHIALRYARTIRLYAEDSDRVLTLGFADIFTFNVLSELSRALSE